ncbi:YncE family protein [bacterium]|nr:YncE family protein [bacterium]
MKIQKVLMELVISLCVGVTLGCSQTIKQSISNLTINVGKGPDALFLTPLEDYLYVANVEDTMITVIETNTDKVIKQINIKLPWGFTRLGQSNLVAVSGYEGDIAIIDFSKHEIVKSKRFESALGGITSASTGDFIFVNVPEANKVLKINANNLEMVGEYKTGNGPDGVAIAAGDKKLYVTNTQDGTISIIDVTTSLSKILSVGGKPELIHFSLDKTKFIISNFDGNMVHIVDASTDAIVTNISNLAGPEDIAFSRDDKTLYVVNFNNSQVTTYNATTYSKLETIYTVGEKPIGIAVLGTSKLYVSNYGDNSVSVIKK